MKNQMKMTLAVIALVGLCGTDVCTAKNVRHPVPVKSCWAAMDVKSGDIRQSIAPVRVDATTLAVDTANMMGRGYQVITWTHLDPNDECKTVDSRAFGDPA